MRRNVKKSLLAAGFSFSLLQPITVGVVGSMLVGAASGVARAQTLNSEAIVRIAQAITVRIEGATQGSGVLVKREGNRYTVLTAWHVVSGQRAGEELDIYTPDGRRHPVKTEDIQRVGGVDMATLLFESNNIYQVTTVGDSGAFTRGNPAIVAGFPRTKQSGIFVSTGVVIANADIGIDNGYQLIYTTRTEIGMSGGPVLDSAGRLVAIHGRGELDSFVSEVTSRAIKTGANKGVPINHFFNLSGAKTSQGSARAPVSADDYIAQATALIESEGSWDDVAIQSTSIRLLSRAIEIQPSSVAYFYRGAVKMMLRDYDASLRDLEVAKQLNPYDHKTISALAHIYTEVGKRDLAIQALVSYLEKNISKLPAENAHELIHELARTGGKKKALIIVNTAISNGLMNPRLLALRAVIKKWNGDQRGALADFRESMKYGEHRFAESEILDLIREVEGVRSAVNYYSDMIARHPDDSNYYYMIRASEKAKIGDMKGFYVDSIKAFESSAKRSSDHVVLSRAMLKMGDKSGARQVLATAVQLLPRERAEKHQLGLEMAYWQIAQLQKEMGDLQNAIRTINMAIERFPSDPFNYINRASLKQFNLNDKDGALRDYEAAARLSNYDSIFVSLWADEVASQLYESMDQRKLHEAVRIYDEAIAKRPRDGSLFSGRSRLMLRIGDLTRALEDLNKAVALDNNYYMQRAELLLALGHEGEAIMADINRAISSLDLMYGSGLHEIAEFLHERLGQTEKALNLLNTGINAVDISFTDRLYSLRGEIKTVMGDHAAACADHRKAILINTDNYRSAEWLQSKAAANCL